MNDLPPHEKFERQIERIHQLLEGDGATVTWNDHIPDPENPSQPRQIDVAIQRDGSLTHVECRIHKDPQDVTWIEELMGRRISLNADAVIAVSASGFTKTAREKAKRYGIHLRNLESLSPDEIRNWGRKRTVTLTFCEFTQVTLIVRASEPRKPDPQSLTDAEGKPLDALTWRSLFQSLMRKLRDDGWAGAPDTIETEVAAPLLVNGSPPVSATLSTEVRRIEQSVSLATVLEYGDPITSESHAEIGSFELGDTEIIEQHDNVAMTIDLSTIVVPENCCFEAVSVDAGRVVSVRPRIIGTEATLNFRIPIQVQYESPKAPSAGAA